MLPPFLKPNDEIRIISPSGNIDPIYIDGAKRTLKEWGLHPTEGRFSRNKYDRYAGTEEQRTEDLQQALNDPNVKAILCSRGGYGLVKIIDKIDFTVFKKHPKWIIGFSDITVLHNALLKTGISSIHGIMAKHLTELSPTDKSVIQLKNTLFGELPTYRFENHPFNICGEATGKLIGGNLSVLAGLRGTDYDLDFQDSILFIEDIGEEPYKIDRMIQNLRLGRVFESLKGLIIAQFGENYGNESINESIYNSLYKLIKPYNIPVIFNVPIGHTQYNLPIIIGEKIYLKVAEENSFTKYLST